MFKIPELSFKLFYSLHLVHTTSVRRRMSLTFHGALAKCIVDPSVLSLRGLSQKVEKFSTFQAATDPSANQTALCKYTQGHCPMKSPLLYNPEEHMDTSKSPQPSTDACSVNKALCGFIQKSSPCGRGLRAHSHYLRPSTHLIDFAWGTREMNCGSVCPMGSVACVTKLRNVKLFRQHRIRRQVRPWLCKYTPRIYWIHFAITSRKNLAVIFF